MSQITPSDIHDCKQLIKEHRQEIVRGELDIIILEDWIPHLNQLELLLLATHCSASHKIIAGSKYTKSKILATMAINNSETFHVARNTNTSQSTLDLLSKSQNHLTRLGVAENPNTPSYILESLAEENSEKFSYRIRAFVALNKNTPVSILTRLAKDENKHVRRCVAMNLKTDANTLKLLAMDSELPVVEAFLRNPNSGMIIFDILESKLPSNMQQLSSIDKLDYKKITVAQWIKKE
jgi:hypothetical protein